MVNKDEGPNTLLRWSNYLLPVPIAIHVLLVLEVIFLR